AARRPRGLRAPARPAGDDAVPAADVREHGRRCGGDRRRRARRVHRRPEVSQSITRTGTEMRSYYGRPVIKEPTWTWEIPVYFFTGGLSGASSVLSLSAKLFGNEKLSRTALYIGAVADVASPALLVSDLGRPERFHHMLRVFKVTSPMNVGAWILFLNGGASMTAAVLELLGRLRPVKLVA